MLDCAVRAHNNGEQLTAKVHSICELTRATQQCLATHSPKILEQEWLPTHPTRTSGGTPRDHVPLLLSCRWISLLSSSVCL
eukprot:5134391-Amphidinium_carterae.1